jgi:hypothetical protein
MSTPATLPANFFEGKTGQAAPPKTLPADFDFKKGEAPKPDTSPLRGATQATGLSADKRSPGQRIWDEVRRGLASAQPGQGLKPQPTMTANAAQFAGMAGDTLAQFGVVPPAAEAAGAAERMIRGVFKPAVTKVPVVSKLLDAQGNPIVHEVEQVGESAAGRAVGLTKEGIKKVLAWINNHKVESYVMFKAAEELGLGPHKAVKMLHIASKD